MRRINLILLAATLFLGSCVEPFVPDTARYEDILAIECRISDDYTAPARLMISTAAPIVTEEGDRLTRQPKLVSGATAQILSRNGIIYPFTETAPGTYLITDQGSFVAGMDYKLIINYGGNQFESDFERLRPGCPIENIRASHIVNRIEEDGEVVDGYRFYVTSRDSGTEPAWYRWDMEATWEYKSPYTATHIWDGREQKPETNREFRICWKTKTINGLYIGSTSGLSQNQVIDAPLNFESQYGDELTVRYCLTVRQYSINPSAYAFWEIVDNLVNQAGGLYETQPFRIEGNIRCTTDPNLPVAGVFEVAGVSVARAFVDRPQEFTVVPLECVLSEVGTQDYPWFRLPVNSFVTQDTQTGKFLTASPACYDCRQRGGTLTKPPFWEDF
ncbi:MAG: hypothetical protein A2X22_08945 [Bacteroidetes bacterium GWF2_49_14]|nr:MAG: hypothetical protein A2X22_08945 [Bacteroidetes bacterium GWF2_49_14]HBB91169.1 hypothetical protein [Bacteroidales bacterium]